MPFDENKAECDNGEELIKALTPLSRDSTKGENLKEEPENLYELMQRIIIFYLYFVSIQCIKNLCTSYNEKNEAKVKSFLLNELFYKTQIFLCVNSLITELFKLFDKKYRKDNLYSFKKIIELLSDNQKELLHDYDLLYKCGELEKLRELRDKAIAHNDENILLSYNIDTIHIAIHTVITKCYDFFIRLLKEADTQTKTKMNKYGLWRLFEEHFVKTPDTLFFPFLPHELAGDYKNMMTEELIPFKRG